jgi:hypothetical protein
LTPAKCQKAHLALIGLNAKGAFTALIGFALPDLQDKNA